MTVMVTSMFNDSQTIDSVALPAWARQFRARRTTALTTAETAKKVQIDEVDALAGSDSSFTVQEVVPVTTDTVQVNDSTELLIVKPAGTIAALTVVMPVKPYDGQRVRVSTTQVVTSLTHSAGGSDTLDGALTAGTANGFGEWCYSKADTTWYRVG